MKSGAGGEIRCDNVLMSTAIDISEDMIQTISIKRETSLGLSLVGGLRTSEGALVQIKSLIPGGDCHKDGRLRPGDQVVSVNKESLFGVSCEEAKSILNRVKLRKCSFWDISYIRPEGEHGDAILSASKGHQKTDLLPKMSSTPDSTKSNIASQSGCIKEQHLSDTSVPYHGRNQQRTTSLNPDVRLKVEKLEMALIYLGINLTEEQKQLMRSHMEVEANDTVPFGDFIHVAKEILKLQLEDRDFRHYFMAEEFEDNHSIDSVTSQVQSCDLSDTDEINRLRRDKEDSQAQIRSLKEKLLESEKRNAKLSGELCNVRKEAKAAIDETRALRNRIHLAEVAQKQARGMEVDYEEVIRLLEAEIMELKSQLSEHSGQTNECTQDLKRRITVLDCQLRKSETARKAFEMSTLKLLQFVENIHEVLPDNVGSTLSLCDHAPTMSSQMKILGKNRLGVMAALAAEAKDLSLYVRSLIEADCLPYGWEEAYTADGIKYFINHVTEATSWTHPIYSALSRHSPEEDTEDSPRDLLELTSC
ncbi:syntaxin-binding protein 4 [Hyla sarda]|uniref:syntaxin-binding protein 4 n=1 Tax=Hyla sarda TaxID=327740 RepID=UPI0024C2479A|nr:syntaxin-binding protein 4 [Hyla sarda]